MPIDLAKPRVIAFTDRKRKYTLTLKPITDKMWLKYFAGIISVSENTAEGSSSSYDSSGARLELLQSALVDATGYTKEGVSIAETSDWQGKLPMSHRKAAADLLTAVTVVPTAVSDDDEFPTLGFETITLSATWTAAEDGEMQAMTGLRHVFNSPTADHQKRYSRAMSRSIVVGGSRTGQTRWLGAQDVLAEIYDELIASVEGYVIDGQPVTEDTITLMDTYHKVAAATALFTPVEVEAK